MPACAALEQLSTCDVDFLLRLHRQRVAEVTEHQFLFVADIHELEAEAEA